jgi:hypothetical protein
VITIAIYLRDLTRKKQKELRDKGVADGNMDVMPITIVQFEEEEGDVDNQGMAIRAGIR